MHTPSKPLHFEANGTCLLYYYKPFILRSTAHYMKYIIPFVYIAKMIPNNPFYLMAPVSLPIMICLEFWLIKRLVSLKNYNARTVCEIYLHDDGETLEIIYLNQFWRKLKEDDINELYYIPSIKSPEKDQN